MTTLAPWSAFFTAGQVAFGEYSSSTSGVYRRASAAADRASLRYRSVAAPAGPTTITTFGTARADCAAASDAAGTMRPPRTRHAMMASARRLTNRGHSCTVRPSLIHADRPRPYLEDVYRAFFVHPSGVSLRRRTGPCCHRDTGIDARRMRAPPGPRASRAQRGCEPARPQATGSPVPDPYHRVRG